MIQSGERYAKQSRSSSPLMYQWHEKEYMGAAHGVSGILFLLLRVRVELYALDPLRMIASIESIGCR
jgi:hypothetical protein